MVAKTKSAGGRRRRDPILDENGRGPGEVTREEGWQIVDDRARRYMGMSAEEFIRAWNAGEIEDPDRPEVMRVVMVLGFAR